MHAPVVEHPIFATIEKRIDEKDYKLVKNYDFSSSLDFYFKSGWRTWLKVTVDYVGYDNSDKITRTTFYVKPGFMQMTQYISDAMVPHSVISKINATSQEIIRADRAKYATVRQNRVASALDNL